MNYRQKERLPSLADYKTLVKSMYSRQDTLKQ